MKILIAGGGTGGHVFPAIAIAREFEANYKDAEILFLGTKKGIERKIVPEAGYDLKYIRSEGLVGTGFTKSLKASFKLILSFYDAYKILKGFQPEIVLGMGGYSSGAVVLIAFLMGKPTMIHEQNSIPGLTNRILGRFVRAIAVSYPRSITYFSKSKTHLTGNPVREEIHKGNKKRGYLKFGLKEGLFTIFVFGGSQGASSINHAIMNTLEYLKPLKENIQFLHQTGYKDLDVVKNHYHTMGFKAATFPFITDMSDAYAVSDLVVSRAGAITIAEITLCGKASILIPYPFAAGKHQEHNAEALKKIGATEIIHERNLDGASLSSSIQHLFTNKNSLREMEKKSRTLGKPEAAKKILEIASRYLINEDLQFRA